MSGDTVELGLILRNTQQAMRASEAALAIAQRIETEFGHRFSGLEARFSGLEGRFSAIEGRVTVLAAGQNSLQRAVLRIADTQDDQGGRLTRIEAKLDAIEAALAAIAARLP
jgi:hypothetical protein